MPLKYTVLTFIFGDYDLLREPTKVDTNAEYICISDKVRDSKIWKVAIDHKLLGVNPIYASYYVRYHPFEYAETNIVFVMDASIQINDELTPICNEFVESDADLSIMLANFRDDEDKIDTWLNKYKRISQQDADKLTNFIAFMNQRNMRGSTASTCSLYKRDNQLIQFLDTVWDYLLRVGTDGVPNRLDEVVFHKVLFAYGRDLNIFPVSPQMMQSTYMTYSDHNNNIPVKLYQNYDQFYYLCGQPLSPVRFDKYINFPRTYRFHTEAILLTKYLNSSDLDEWLDHHLNKVKFDHIHIFDNESMYDVQQVIAKYGERVSYQKVYGHPRQYRLYDAYINNISSAEWVMPIDDDEYLDISDFGSVYEAIRYYENKLPHLMVLGIRWKHLFPRHFHSERSGKVLDYCTEENPELAKTFMYLGDTTVKCIVKRYGNVHYEETWENPAGGHVPKHTCFLGAAMCDGRAVMGCGIPDCPDHLEDEKIRLIHCRYKGYSDWMKKYGNNENEKNCRTVCDSYQRNKVFKFNELLPTLD